MFFNQKKTFFFSSEGALKSKIRIYIINFNASCKNVMNFNI